MIKLRLLSKIACPLFKRTPSNAYIKNILLTSSYIVFNRYKYTKNTGVKGIRNREFPRKSTEMDCGEKLDEELDLDDKDYDVIVNSTMNVTNESKAEQSVLVIQPYVKWGRDKTATKPELLLQEAKALINSIPGWKIESSLNVPLETLEKKTFFGKGKLDELKKLINEFYSKGRKISRIFISKGTLSFIQKRFLEEYFQISIMDRYSVVIQILRLHAISSEARIQVAMAEIPYIWARMKDLNQSTSRRQGYYLTDTQKELLKKRETKLKQKLQEIRTQRKLLRNRRKQKDYPTIAVVGYTNAGKTSLIKALTDKQTLQPRDQLFATLDVTAHAGILPCNLEVIYMDTVGFLSDIPTGLIECFVATLEDAMLADVIVHVQDLSHENYLEQKQHVENTLNSLVMTTEMGNEFNEALQIINVGNKIDLVEVLPPLDENIKLVSSKTLFGIHDLLLEIQLKILKVTGRVKITFRVNSGSEEMAWLYKNTAITNTKADPKNQQYILIDAIITQSKLQQFKSFL